MIGASLFVLWCTCVAAQSPQQVSASSSPKVDAALQKGEAALKAQRFRDALNAFNQANSLLKRRSAEAFFGISRAYHGLRDYKREAEACLAGLDIVLGADERNPDLSGRLFNQLGMAQASQAAKPDAPEMKEAAQSFFNALTVSTLPIAMFNLGVTLMQLGEDDAGRESLEDYLKTGAETPEAELAKKYLANPQLARDAFRHPVKKSSKSTPDLFVLPAAPAAASR